MQSVAPIVQDRLNEIRINKTFADNGFKKYMHKSGFTAWSKTNLCEYSDEWMKL